MPPRTMRPRFSPGAQRAGLTASAIQAALERLLAANKVHIESSGPRSKPIRYLALDPIGSAALKMAVISSSEGAMGGMGPREASGC